MTDLLYKRNLRNTFAIKKNISEDQIENYFGKIVLQNRIEGLIRPSVISVNGMYEIHYDITGMQSMDTIFQTKEIGFEELQRLFFCLEMLLRETEKYLLDTAHFVFEPKQLFYSFDAGAWYFVYDFSHEEHTLNPLADYLIERIDPTDEKATKVAYDFYEKVENNIVSMDILEGYLERPQEVEGKEENEKEDYAESLTEYTYEEAEEKEVWKGKEIIQAYMKEIAGGGISMAGLLFAVYKIAGMWFAFTKVEFWLWMGAVLISLVLGIVCCIVVVLEKKKEKSEPENLGEYHDTDSVYQIEPEQKDVFSTCEADNQCEAETVFVEKAEFHKNHSLAEIRKDKEITHFIESYPYIIGKDKERVHLTVKDRGVSHVHARLLMEQDEVYIEDLCSKNGTYINDFLIEPHEKTILHRGDILILGSSEFVFR